MASNGIRKPHPTFHCERCGTAKAGDFRWPTPHKYPVGEGLVILCASCFSAMTETLHPRAYRAARPGQNLRPTAKLPLDR